VGEVLFVVAEDHNGVSQHGEADEDQEDTHPQVRNVLVAEESEEQGDHSEFTHAGGNASEEGRFQLSVRAFCEQGTDTETSCKEQDEESIHQPSSGKFGAGHGAEEVARIEEFQKVHVGTF